MDQEDSSLDKVLQYIEKILAEPTVTVSFEEVYRCTYRYYLSKRPRPAQFYEPVRRLLERIVEAKKSALTNATSIQEIAELWDTWKHRLQMACDSIMYLVFFRVRERGLKHAQERSLRASGSTSLHQLGVEVFRAALVTDDLAAEAHEALQDLLTPPRAPEAEPTATTTTTTTTAQQ
eukprot:gnl/Trimastix_PCT/4966.p1 GENE.gnl/Trimastix_PCT/4966~~gnl/Trimastix_PCT/4966.p1  ORF type:complete len:177 (+),score=13.26 gnl/Trimastix_PCT/4966:36-566(+)